MMEPTTFGVCVCGLSVLLHYDRRNRRLSCDTVARVMRLIPPAPPQVPVHPARLLSFPTPRRHDGDVA